MACFTPLTKPHILTGMILPSRAYPYESSAFPRREAGGECLTFDQLALRSPLGKAAVRCVARELTVTLMVAATAVPYNLP